MLLKKEFHWLPCNIICVKLEIWVLTFLSPRFAQVWFFRLSFMHVLVTISVETFLNLFVFITLQKLSIKSQYASLVIIFYYERYFYYDDRTRLCWQINWKGNSLKGTERLYVNLINYSIKFGKPTYPPLLLIFW